MVGAPVSEISLRALAASAYIHDRLRRARGPESCARAVCSRRRHERSDARDCLRHCWPHTHHFILSRDVRALGKAYTWELSTPKPAVVGNICDRVELSCG